MTLLGDDLEPAPAEALITATLTAGDADASGGGPPAEPAPGAGDHDRDRDDRPAIADLRRPVLAAALATAAAGFVTGGIFGSWSARLIGLVAAVAGAAGVIPVLRSRRQGAALATVPVAAFAAGLLSLVPSSAGPSQAGPLVRSALKAGQALRPPVPFDPGWRLIIIMVIGLLGFTAGWIATAMDKPRLSIAVPIPVVLLTAITQPSDGQFLTGAGAFLFILGALAVLFGGDLRSARDLGSRFELKRAVRAAALGVPLIVLLVAFNSASFLFPKSVYNPTTKPQKPRSVSGLTDRVLFEVKTDTGLTGPWRTGALDTYEHNAWKLPPVDRSRLKPVTSDEPLDGERADRADKTVTIVVHDLGNSPVLPDLAGIVAVQVADDNMVFDPRSQVLRLKSGRAPAGLEYTMRLPAYATDQELAAAQVPPRARFADQLAVPPMPPFVAKLFAEAPVSPPYVRMQYVRRKLLDNVTAKGAGVPVDITPARVDDLLNGSKKGSPFEISAAEAMIARWAGVPSRVGFGFDGLNKEETGVVSVRPRNAAQWLEVYFTGFGWLPLVSTPKKAETALANDPNVRVNPAVQPSDDVSVHVYVPYRIVDAKQLYQRVRGVIALYLPFVLLAGLGYLGYPAAAKLRRRSKRRAWAASLGPQVQVAVEYAEFRDLATDLNVADLYSSPLEYLFMVRPDDEHAEFAWLVSRVVFGDLAETAGPVEVAAALHLGASMRRRLLRGQPLQSRVLAFLSNASLQFPYSEEMPNLRPLRLPKARVVVRRLSARARLRARRVWVRARLRPARRRGVL